MRIVATSDTHEKHSGLTVPDGDVFIHAGDFTMIGEPDQVRSFNAWLRRLPHKYKIVIAGNHDRSFEVPDADQAALIAYGQMQLSNATHYLCASGCEIEGKTFWGSPYTPFFSSDYWKFHYDPAQIGTWDRIPEKLDVLITHGPARNHLDKTVEGDNAGCYDLFRRIREMIYPDVAPRFHVFGHIHEAYGRKEIGDCTTLLNVSAVDRLYRLRENPCVEFEI